MKFIICLFDFAQEIKGRCDLYYKNPPVSLQQIRNSRLHAVYIIDVEEASVQETDPGTYIERTAHWKY